MIIDLEQVESGQTVELPFREAIPTGDEATSPGADRVAFPLVEGWVRVGRVADRIRVEGVVAGSAALVCGRCLRTFGHLATVRFAEEFGSALESPVQGRRELTDEDVVEDLPGAELDITEIVRQHLVMAMPLAPLCREDCRGWCPRCGGDLNAGDCTCGPEPEDPRLEPLRGLQTHRAEPERRRERSGGA